MGDVMQCPKQFFPEQRLMRTISQISLKDLAILWLFYTKEGKIYF